jgi:hypothetical protein
MEDVIPKYLKWNRHEVLQCALILESAMRSFESVAIATVKNFEMSIFNSGVQCRAVIDFRFRFFGYKLIVCFATRAPAPIIAALPGNEGGTISIRSPL